MTVTTLAELEPTDGWVDHLAPRPRQAVAKNQAPRIELDLPEHEERAIRYLCDDAPEGSPGNLSFTAYTVACRVRDFAISEANCFTLMSTFWESAPLMRDAEDLQLRINNAYRHAKGEIGGALGRLEFDDTTSPAEGKVEQPGRPRLYYLLSTTAIEAALSAPLEPLIEGLIDQRTLTVMYGSSNAGKTFVALEFAFHIANGRPWQGRETTKGLVVYIAAEGGRGILRRAAALHKHYGWTEAVAIVPCPINLRDSRADMEALLALVRDAEAAAGAKAILIVVDTLSRALAGGDENGPVDMGAFVKNVDKIRAATESAILVVHHSGKDAARGARGHSLLRAATDTEIEIAENKIKITKQRDMEAAKDVGFRLKEIEIGRDPKGRRVTSCVVEIVTGSEFVQIEPNAEEAAMIEAFEVAAREKNPDNPQEVILTTEEWDDSFLHLADSVADSIPAYRTRTRTRTRLATMGHFEKVKMGQWLRLYSAKSAN